MREPCPVFLGEPPEDWEAVAVQPGPLESDEAACAFAMLGCAVLSFVNSSASQVLNEIGSGTTLSRAEIRAYPLKEGS